MSSEQDTETFSRKALGVTPEPAPSARPPDPEPPTDPGEARMEAAMGPLTWLLTRIFVPGAVVVGGVVCMGFLFAMRPHAERTAVEAAVPEVSVATLEARALPANIEGSGVVVPAKQVRLAAEVQGKVVTQSDKLVPGGRFRKGDLLVQLDSRDYRAAVEAQERAVKQAELELALERNRGEVARREWELLGDKAKVDADLALRKPHLATAEAAHEAALAALEQAQANLGRTRVTAPFDAMVIEEAVDPGQIVGPASPVATLVGTEAFWVQVSLPVEKLSGIDVPGITADAGSTASIVQKLGPDAIVREGKVLQLMGQLDPQTRTAQLLVEIPDPLVGEGLPLLPGAWVDVAITGKSLENTWEIPRTALEKGEYAWVVDPEDTLRRRNVTVGWRTPESVIVTGGIEPGDRLVTSPLALPIDGQLVKPIEEAG
ncbi:MAG: efflux RND transporter periplasmic adaptor subunit [Alphaproteobacteria bacterium]|nr:efflux RND transporter periplasmic adaptor subunit [Alphaproteobacteria bacterium]